MSIGEGMRAGDLERCGGCGKGLMHTGMPLFWRVRIERMGIDRNALQRVHGMEQYFGGTAGAAVAIARVFEDPELANPLGDGHTILLCEDCAIESQHLPTLNERAAEARAKRAAVKGDRDEYPTREASFVEGKTD